MAKQASKSSKVSRSKKTGSRKKKAAVSSSGVKRRVKVPVDSVLLLGRVLHDREHVDKFARAAKRAGMSFTMHADSVKFVRRFVARNKLQLARNNLRMATNNLQQSADGQVDPFQRDPFEMFKEGG